MTGILPSIEQTSKSSPKPNECTAPEECILQKNILDHRLNDLFQLARDGDPVQIRVGLPLLYSEANLARIPLETRVGAFVEWSSKGGFEIVETIRCGFPTIEMITRHPLTDEYWRVAVSLESKPPHRIDSLSVGRAPLPSIPTQSDIRVAKSFIQHVAACAKKSLFSGAVLIGRHESILGQGAFGFANRDFSVPNTALTRFNVASLTKSWTAVAVCQLIEAGRLALTDPLSDFLSYPDIESARTIEIRHLLSHTSGLGTYFNPRFDATPRTNIRSLDDFLAFAADERPRFVPGSDWHYSNIGMILLGKVIQSVTGACYHDYVEANVLRPAGMKTAGFIELDRVNSGVAVGYHKVWTQTGPVIVNALFDWAVRGAPDGCGFATVSDIWNFAQSFRSGRLVSDSMVELMTTAKPEINSPYYGYGFAIHPERALFGHSGGLIGAGANLDMTRTPEGWTVVVLTNDLSMRGPVLKARQLIGVDVPEDDAGRAYLPRGGMTLR